MSMSEQVHPDTQHGSQKASDQSESPKRGSALNTKPDNIRPWGDEGVSYVPPSKGNDGYNAGE